MASADKNIQDLESVCVSVLADLPGDSFALVPVDSGSEDFHPSHPPG